MSLFTSGLSRSMAILVIFFTTSFAARAYTISEIQAVKYNGQVFLTWKNATPTNLQYNVYRSASPFTSVASLNSSTYLGFVRDNSAKNIRKSTLYSGNFYYKITATAPPLASDRGLYVATCTSNGAYYYAVTVTNLSTGQEDKSVLNSTNSLITPISESVANPQPVLQLQSVENDGTLRYEYAQWGNNQTTSLYPAFTNAGSYAWNFTVFKAGNSTNGPIYVLFKDDDPFSTSGITICEDCNVIKIDDRLPNGIDTYWSGWNDSYNMYSSTNSVPSSGVVKMYTQVRLKKTIEWVRKNIAADSNKVYLQGLSHNAYGALLTSQMWPEIVTAVFAKNAPILIKALNNSDREAQWCNTTDNFDTDYIDPNTGLPIPVWKLFNMCHMYNVNTNKGGPFISGINGKQDVTVGWVQKYYWYDSVNASRQGGAWYWDQRTHNNDNAKFTDEEVTPVYGRFSLARSYPAFSFCSINQNPGNGTPNNGDAWGAINGYLDWNDASIVDNPTDYSITCFVKDLYAGGTPAPSQYDSCTSDITIRRIQKFKPNAGQTITWKVKNSTNKVVQQGSVVYNGGPLTLYGVKIYRNNSVISFSTQSCTTLYYTDADSDGYGSAADPGTIYCNPPSGVVTNKLDCNDGNFAVKPGAQEVCDANDVDEDCDGLSDDADGSVTGKITYYTDSDHDSYGSASATGIAYCNPPAWFTTNHTDCNDGNAAIKPGAQEVCDVNDVDEDCDGLADDSDPSATGKATYYVDADHDNYGSATAAGVPYCNKPAWYNSNHTDCNDANASINPSSQEVCDANDVDEDCDGLSDDADVSVTGKITYYADADHDGFGALLGAGVSYCNPPLWNVTNHTDCNDLVSTINPSAIEICNLIDDDCDISIDENVGILYYQDGDNDGYGNPSSFIISCNGATGYVPNNSDCNDNNAAVNPGQQELCNGADDNCNAVADEGAGIIYYQDADNDGYGNSTVTIKTCGPQPAGYVTAGNDCNDQNALINPGIPDICDGIDNNCNGVTDENAISVSITASGPTTGCKSDLITLSASGTNIGSYKWYKGTNTNAVSGQTNSTYTLNYDNTTVKTIVSNSYGCSATSNVISLTSILSPSAVITVSGGNLDLCSGPVSLSASGGTNYTWQWYRNQVVLAGATSINYSPLTPGSYTVVVTNLSGCSKTSAAVTVAGFVTYYVDADLDGYGSSLDLGTAYCNVPALLVTNNSDCNDSNPNIYPGAPDICDGQDNNCNGTIDENAITVSISPAGPVSGCKSELVTFTATGTNIETYKWYKGSNANSVAGQTNATYSLTYDNTTVKAVAGNSFGCTATSNITTITSIANPTANITASNLNLCLGTVLLTASGGTSISWQWYKNGSMITGATNNSYTATTTGSYEVNVTSTTTGCSKLSAAATVINACKTSTGNPNDEITMQVYPNPSSGLFHISLDNIRNSAALVLQLSDVAGKVIFNRKDGVQPGNYATDIDLTQYNDGVYLLEIIVGNQVIRRQIINQ